jgi:putative transcriptional regulator
MMEKGNILISEPFLGDPNFERSVVLLCENNNEGAFGFILNRPSILTLDSVLPGIVASAETLYIGGPLAQDSLYFIYRNHVPLEKSVAIGENLYWGGDFEQLKTLIQKKKIDLSDFRFFLGYSGWGEGQLKNEMNENSWILEQAGANDIFDFEPNEMWRMILKKKGGKYKMISNYPIDPRMN